LIGFREYAGSLLFVIEWGEEKVMDHQKLKHARPLRRRHYIRRRIRGTSERPRLTVYRSSKHILVQIIDDLKGITLAAASSQMKDLKAELKYGGNVAAAKVVGKKIAEVAKSKGIELVCFDRGHY